MAIYFAKETGPAAQLAQGLGTGLGQGLQNLAHMKMQEMQQAKAADRASQFWQQAGLPSEMARAISDQPESIQKSLLDRLEGLSLGYPQTMQQSLQEGLGYPQQQMMQQSLPQENGKIAYSPQQQGGLKIGASSQERRHRQILEEKKLKRLSDQDRAAFKDTSSYRTKMLETEEKAQEALDAIKEAQELEKSGKLPSQDFASFLKGSEWEDVPGFLSGSAEAFNKILANFQRGAKDIYGGRITNFEMEQFLRTLPTLQHSPEGRARIFSMMKNYNRAGKEKAKLMRQIIHKNNGIPPLDIHEQVNEKFKPIAKHLAAKFKDELKEAEKLQSTLSNRTRAALSYGAGKLVSSIPGALKGAATGAILGSVIPGLGTTAGALAGGGLGALGGSGLLSSLKGLS